MKNIGIYVEQNLEEKLKSFSEDKFFDMKKYKKNIEFDLIIIDIKTQNIDKKLSEESKFFKYPSYSSYRNRR